MTNSQITTLCMEKEQGLLDKYLGNLVQGAITGINSRPLNGSA